MGEFRGAYKIRNTVHSVPMLSVGPARFIPKGQTLEQNPNRSIY